MSVIRDPLLRRFQALLPGQYEIDRELGRGGMATVYLAQDLRHKRQVAIKLLQPELTTPATAERFLREIQITAKLQHPHIVPLLDSGARDALVYYVMPHIEGESLRDRMLWDRQCQMSNAVQIARQVASALAYAHGRGVIHRDIKPENILLSANQAMLADFGIARAIQDSTHQVITAVGTPLGTPAYMSPEQAAGAQDIDHRSDLYSLGCVLFEMLAGRPPFVAETVGRVLRMHLTEPPPRVKACRSAAPDDLDAIIGKALAKDPADRFQTAEEMGEALGLVEAAETLERSTPPGSAPRRTPATLLKAATPGPVVPGVNTTSSTLPSSRLWWGGGLVAVAAIALLARTGGRDQPAAPVPAGSVVAAAAAGHRASIGVKPLDAIGADSISGTASAGITEEISAQLSKLSQLRVISRTTMAVVGTKGWTTRQAADSLGIQYLLEGSVQRSGRDLAITLQLIDAPSDTHVWSETFRQPFRDILMTRQDIARKVVEALAGAVGGLTLTQTGHESKVEEAVQARAAGGLLTTLLSEERLDRAITAYQRALELDPQYAAAAADLSDALRRYVVLGFRTRRDPFRSLAESIRWGETAVRLDPNLAEGYGARGAARLAAGMGPEAVLGDIERAVTLAPAAGGIRLYRGVALSRAHRYDEAIKELEAATALDPLSAATRGGGLALTLLAARRYGPAAAQAAEAAARDPVYEGWRAIQGVALMLGGDPAACVALGLRAEGAGVAALCERRMGRAERATAMVDSLSRAADAGEAPVYVLGFLAAYRAEEGDVAGALAWLGRGFQLSPTAFDFRFLDSGLFDRVSGDPAFGQGLAAIVAKARARIS